MKTFIITALVFATAIIFISAFACVKGRLEGKSGKKALRINLLSFALVLAAMAALSVTAFAAEEQGTADTQVSVSESAEETKEEKSSSSNGIGLLAAGLATGLAGIGGGIAVAAGAPSAISATSENPKAFGKAIIFVALGESIALYGVVISILILSNL